MTANYEKSVMANFLSKTLLYTNKKYLVPFHLQFHFVLFVIFFVLHLLSLLLHPCQHFIALARREDARQRISQRVHNETEGETETVS